MNNFLTRRPSARAMVMRYLDWQTMYYRTKDALDTAFVGIQRIAIDKDKLQAQVKRLQERNEALWDMYIDARNAQKPQEGQGSDKSVLDEQSSTETQERAEIASYKPTEATSISALEAHYQRLLDVKNAQIEELREWCKLAYPAACEAFDKGLFSAAKVIRKAPDSVVTQHTSKCVKGGE